MNHLSSFNANWRRLFGEIDTYGFNEIIRMYCNHPKSLPISANIYHGWYLHPPREADLRSKKSTVLVFNKRHQVEWKKHSNIPVYIAGAPFVHYRRMMNIQRKSDAAGTIVYPGHDATSNDFVFNQKELCEQLNDLDAKYKPITVSVHEMDIVNNKDRMYRDYGFNIYCPGPRKTIDFVRNVYAQLSSHKYSCGNHIGTNILYSVEVGIPFFFIGNIGHEINRRTKEKVIYKRTKEQLAFMNEIIEAFKFPVDEITPDQKSIIIPECGVDDCVSPDELRRILLNEFFWRDLPRVIARAPRSIARRLSGQRAVD
jgi:hypothetical protein